MSGVGSHPRIQRPREASGTTAGALPVVFRFTGWGPMTEIYEFWNAMWHEAWAPWDGLWLFQLNQRPIDRALGADSTSQPATSASQGRQLGAVFVDGLMAQAT